MLKKWTTRDASAVDQSGSLVITDGDAPKPTILSHYAVFRPPFVGEASCRMFDLFLFIGRLGMIFFSPRISQMMWQSVPVGIFRYSEDLSLHLRHGFQQVFFRPDHHHKILFCGLKKKKKSGFLRMRNVFVWGHFRSVANAWDRLCVTCKHSCPSQNNLSTLKWSKSAQTVWNSLVAPK